MAGLAEIAIIVVVLGGGIWLVARGAADYAGAPNHGRGLPGDPEAGDRR